jgi:hypothetical protein
MEDLEPQFHSAMLDIHRRARNECKYNATRFLAMVNELGGLKTAQRLLATREPSDGYRTLWEHGRLDLTVERLVLRKQFRDLFTEEELRVASDRLREYGYTEHLDTPDV